MASVSFPTTSAHDERHHLHQSSSSATQENFFGSSYNPSSSFQINPLSHHPPRTPRTSIISNGSNVYGTELYGTPSASMSMSMSMVDSSINGSVSGVSVTEESETIQEKQLQFEEEEEVEVEDEYAEVKNLDALTNKVQTPAVWREILKTSSGRDKAFKVMQYSLKVYLLFHSTVSSSRLLAKRTKAPWETELVHRLESATSGLSLTRKLLIMGNWLTPFTSILDTQDDDLSFTQSSSSKGKPPAKPLLQMFLHSPPPTLLDLLNGFSDDIYAFYRLGLIGKKTGERAARFSDWCWFLGTIAALIELTSERNITKDNIHKAESMLYSESMTNPTAKAGSSSASTKFAQLELVKLQRQDFWIRMQRLKLVMDLIFVSYDVFKIKRAKKSVQTFAGLSAALLSTARLFHNHRNALILKATHK